MVAVDSLNGTVTLRVVHFSRGFEDYVISLANGLAEIADVHVVLALSDEWMQRELSAKVQVYCSRAPRVSDLRNVASVVRTARYVKQLEPDVIHFQNGVAWEGLVSLLNPRVPTVTTIHDVTGHLRTSQYRVVPQALLDVMPRRSSGVIVHGARLAADARDRYRRDDGNPIIRIIPHPVISRYGRGSAKPQASGRILFFGHLDRYKGVEVLLHAMPKVVTDVGDVTLRVAGRATKPDYYRDLTPAGVRVEWDLRYQTDADVRQAFSWADVVVLPYIEASQSGVLQVATSFAVPVVATRVGALPDAIDDGRNGLLAEPGDATSLANAIIKVLTNVELRETIIKSLIRERDDALVTNKVALANVELYLDVIDQARRRLST